MDSSILLEDSGVIHDPTVGWGFTIQWPKSLGFSSCRTLRVLEAFLGFKVFRDSETEVICQPSHFQCCAHGCCPQVARAPQQNGYLGSHAYLHSVPLSWRKQIHWILRHDLVDEKDKMSSCQHFWSKYKQTYIYIVIAICFVYLHQFDFVVFIYSTGIVQTSTKRQHVLSTVEKWTCRSSTCTSLPMLSILGHWNTVSPFNRI